MTDIYHPGELIHGNDHGDTLEVDLSENEPGMIRVTIEEEWATAGTIYVKPDDAIEFANALMMYAEYVRRAGE